ncbi:ABC transporter ATP-binding protein [Knoellia sp. 3-2P3]|uniref:ABC transporter ATP-binding protein n=1 Tax=unclassified Knoellia TaxID=2618719 RepID=UPI0023DC79E1|nr:ABC transporter ATP-binding protein [Knoellia sp. 3-2P3]MDF2092141.1 ABC transporter ATP-binding protein [Knoellia sp. 3-2P3]
MRVGAFGPWALRRAPTTLGGNEEGAIERTEQRTTPPQTQTPTAVPRPDGEWTLQATGLTRRFGERLAVEDVSFHVAPGETYGLLGPNGAGKTTTIRVVCGLLAPDAGEVTVAGLPVTATATEAKARIGYVPQEVSLYPDLTARENLQFFGRLYRLGGAELKARVAEVLELVGLTDRRDDRVESFSGGMKRRLNIGASLLHRPELLVLDEPTVGVDPQSRHAIMESIATLGTAGMAVLYTTHYMEEAERLCDRVGIIDHGHLVAEGTHRELVARVGEKDRITLSASGSLARFAEECRRLEGIEQVDTAGSSVHLIASDGRRRLAEVLAVAVATDTAVRSVEVEEPDLEAVFLHLTGTALRE